MTAQIKKLYEIEDLNVKAGLSFIGQNQESYIGILKYFSENCKKYIDELNAAFKDNNWNHYAIKSHALKGVLANLGADTLSKWAAKLEDASKSIKTKSEIVITKEERSAAETVCRNETGAFSEALQRFQEKLCLILAENSNSGMNETVKTNQGTSASRGTPQIFYEQIYFLNTACADYSFTETKKIFSVLDNYDWDDDRKTELNNLKKIIASFEYEKAQANILVTELLALTKDLPHIYNPLTEIEKLINDFEYKEVIN